MRYGVTIIVDASIYIEVEADSKDEALDKAYESDKCYVSICHHCAGKIAIGDVLYDHDANDAEELVPNPS